MKNSFNVLCAIVLLFTLMSEHVFSQPFLVNTAGSGSVIGETDANNQISAIGIGDFVANGVEPEAALDVRVPILYPSNQYHYAEAFHTTTGQDYGAVWRMFIDEGTQTEKFHIMNPDPGNPVPNYALKDDIHLKVLQDRDGGNMDFFTSDMHWMRLAPAGKYGYLGLNDFVNTGDWYPRSNIHLNRLSANEDVFAQFTNESTGYDNNTQGFKVGIHKDSYSGKTIAELRQYVNAPIVISSSTITSNPSTLTERMRITYGTGGPSSLSNMTKVSISYGNSFNPIRDPVAMLNLGEGINAVSIGNRTWMEVGTHMVRQSDQMYVGIKDEGSDFGCAVINWGDNPTNGDPYGPDMLKFIFTGSYSGGSSVAKNSYDGLEVARMTATGNMGVGSGWNNTNILPKRRLDLIDNAASGGGGSNYPDHVSGPQLRLTHTADATLTGGKFTDFETTSTGNLFIDPWNSGSSGFVGISKNNPGEKLEINSNDASPTSAGGNSGLIFTDLTTASTIHSSAFTGTKGVLSVDANGKVILVEDGSISPTSGLVECGGTISNNQLVKMNNTSSNEVCNSILYDNGTYVGLGLSSGLFSRFQIGGLGTTFSTIGCLIQDSNGDDYFQARDNGHVVIGSAITNKDGRLGIGISYDPEAALIVKTYSTSTTTSGMPSRAMEVRNGSDDKMLSVWADEHVTMGYSSIPSLSGYAGDARLIVNGSGFALAAHFDGDIYTPVVHNTSDSSLKLNVQPIGTASAVINSLNPKVYEYDKINNPSLNLPDGIHFGFLAQEVERILPNLVAEQVTPAEIDSLGNELVAEKRFKTLNYIEIIPLLTQAIKEQQAIIDSLSSRDSLILAKIDQLQDAVSSCCSGTSQRVSSEKNSIDVELTSENAIILKQNDPNPFSERTRISYKIPESVKKAEVIFYTSKGVILKSVVITTRGEGEMNVFASDLSSGIYMYSLVADGKTIDSKQMVCVK